MAGIYALSSVSHTPDLPAGADKNLHALLYAGLAAVMTRALAGGRLAGVTAKVATTAVVVSALYGVSDEIHQSFVPLRQSDSMDVVADTVGAAIAAGVLFAVARVRAAGR